MIEGLLAFGEEALGSVAGKAAHSVESFGTIRPANKRRGQTILPDLNEATNFSGLLTDLTDTVSSPINDITRNVSTFGKTVGGSGKQALTKLGGGLRKSFSSSAAMPIFGAIQMSTQIMQNKQLDHLQESVDMLSLQQSVPQRYSN